MADDVSNSDVTVPLNVLLLSAREALGLSLEHVAGQLNLSTTQLDKLEGDALNPANLSTFERGYVRNYALLLNIEPPVIDRYFEHCNYGLSSLHSVKEYGDSTDKPLLGRMLIKWLLILGAIGLAVMLTMSVFPEILA